MHKTTLYIDEDIALALRHRAGVDGKSQAEHIREALRRYVRDLEQGEGGPPVLPPGAGRFRSGRSDVSTQAEVLLREAARNQR